VYIDVMSPNVSEEQIISIFVVEEWIKQDTSVKPGGKQSCLKM
jgi:hypothetical protein